MFASRPTLHNVSAERQQDDPCHRLLTSFFGVPCGQLWADFYLWELLLNRHPELKAIAEVGSWQGGFSRYLAVQAEGRGLEFRTWDVIEPEPAPPGFVKLDVFADPDPIIRFLNIWEPVLLLCDGGNKPRELRTFAPHIGAGLVVVHDWQTEIGPDDVPDYMEEVYGAMCDELGSMSRVFRVAA